MTTIPEALNEDLEVMDFVNWDAAAASTGFDLPPHPEAIGDLPAIAPSPAPSLAPGLAEDPGMDLAFGDIEGDDWSYWALQHYESTQLQQDVDMSTAPDPDPDHDGVSPGTSQFSWETPEAPCTNCSRWSYQCKRIREGKYRGYCTSCVALRRECSFGPSPGKLTSDGGATFPANPWPTMGDRPETSILHEDELAVIGGSEPISQLRTAVAEVTPLSPRPQHPPKIGARFSRESVKVLKNWVVTHIHHPYPTDEERENLQKITGLNKTQITNWLANARRRGKIQPTRATSPHVGRGYAQAIDIPQRKGTPGLFENMNPLQRWENSPPENEPASVTAIARAVSASGSYSATSGSGRTSPNVWNFSDDGSGRSICRESSASSLGTSHSSGGSFASAFSNQSRGSSIPSFVRSNRGRRRRRRAPPKRADEQLTQPLKTFQCTFCTETFRTKHDWQRHEKSLHLSLERWVCSPDGPRAVNGDSGLTSCVFCGEANPDDAHIESHNFSSCTERTPEERTFYRKDHLRQHLRLVHNVKFLPWSMDKWRVNSPAIRSRCGFCGVVLDSWTVRVDHLAEHFKTGNTMADWKGDWGFDAPVLEMVENSIPPYLIHDERQSPLPFEASQPSAGTPTNAYELLKMELQWWITNKTEQLGTAPSDAETQQEACRIVYGAEVMLKGVGACSSSWLCDLIMSSEDAKRQAAFNPRAPGSSCLSALRINGKSDIFENCEFERELQDYVHAKLLLGLTAMDHELQDESCRILGRMEERSSNPSEALANWFIRMINASSSWLENFRQRAHLPRSEDVGDAYKRSTDPKTIDSTIHNYSRLEAELGEYIQLQRSLGKEPTDVDLQRQARIIVYEVDDEWNQTAADDTEWLGNFRERHSKASRPSPVSSGSLSTGRYASTINQSSPLDPLRPSQASGNSPKMNNSQSPGGSSAHSIKPGARFLNDANCFRRLARDLSRFVTATMSPNNPNRHVPTDEELKHQARWIVYDDDDPFNQTAADNVEWLQRFKTDAGILPPGSGPGLGVSFVAWNVKDGGTGFEPPYVTPNPAAMIEPLHGNPHIYLNDEVKPFESEASTANHFLRTFTQRYPAPAKIFCSRDLENGLTEYVKRELQKTGLFPSDTQLQSRARDIMSMQKTPCDDPVLLGKFKAALQGNLPVQQSLPTGGDFAFDFGAALPISMPTTSTLSAELTSSITTSGPSLSVPAADTIYTEMDLDLNFTEQELNDILQDVSYEIGDNTQLDFSPGSQGSIGRGSGLSM
ncbi:putative C2H2 type zinc finger containing protein [Rosellinia necatrix]|uniref:Putative C2H2 type zinc finger containing protein n=1 Tax=Rosellinia necatrix TaxID=77044 RepID=A0A1W2TAY6_ROSNE|nr:putative C2H2 type zinc finger containing protein [Rosellinia necatrix]